MKLQVINLKLSENIAAKGRCYLNRIFKQRYYTALCHVLRPTRHNDLLCPVSGCWGWVTAFAPDEMTGTQWGGAELMSPDRCRKTSLFLKKSSSWLRPTSGGLGGGCGIKVTHAHEIIKHRSDSKWYGCSSTGGCYKSYGSTVWVNSPFIKS